eukprot:gene85-219_t
MKTIGVLAVQGAFAAHCEALREVMNPARVPSKTNNNARESGDVESKVRSQADLAALRVVQVRSAADLRNLDALVIPGGESTTIRK